MDRKDEAYAIVGLVLVALTLILPFFSITASTIGQYTAFTPLNVFITQFFLMFAGSFLVVIGWRVSSRYATGGLLSKFGRPASQPHKYFWLEMMVSEVVGVFMIVSVFVLTQSRFYVLPDFPKLLFELAASLLLLVGTFLVARSTLDTLGEVKRILAKLASRAI